MFNSMAVKKLIWLLENGYVPKEKEISSSKKETGWRN